MTLDEAIKHCEEQAEIIECNECAKEHRQLAEWLNELKQSKDVLDKIRAEIMKLDDINPDYPMDRTIHISRNEVLQIINKHRNEVNE